MRKTNKQNPTELDSVIDGLSTIRKNEFMLGQRAEPELIQKWSKVTRG